MTNYLRSPMVVVVVSETELDRTHVDRSRAGTPDFRLRPRTHKGKNALNTLLHALQAQIKVAHT